MSCNKMSSEIVWSPVSFDLGWGRISGKTCVVGNGNCRSGLRILGVHGWLDNANSFDTLAPYLPKGAELLVLDLPGHGLSDHLPLGAQYDILTYVLHLKRAVDKSGWDRFIFIGHSMGAGIGNIFTSIFPDQVMALVNLDFLIFKADTISYLQRSTSVLLKAEELMKQKPLVYSEQQAIERLISARSIMESDTIDKDAAYILLPRSAKQVESGYIWTHDQRVRSSFQSIYSSDILGKFISNIKCPVLILYGSKGLVNEYMLNVSKDILDIYRNNAKWFDIVQVHGSHHVHLTHPERVAKPLVPFLQRVAKEAVANYLQAKL